MVRILFCVVFSFILAIVKLKFSVLVHLLKKYYDVVFIK